MHNGTYKVVAAAQPTVTPRVRVWLCTVCGQGRHQDATQLLSACYQCDVAMSEVMQQVHLVASQHVLLAASDTPLQLLPCCLEDEFVAAIAIGDVIDGTFLKQVEVAGDRQHDTLRLLALNDLNVRNCYQAIPQC